MRHDYFNRFVDSNLLPSVNTGAYDAMYEKGAGTGPPLAFNNGMDIGIAGKGSLAKPLARSLRTDIINTPPGLSIVRIDVAARFTIPHLTVNAIIPAFRCGVSVEIASRLVGAGRDPKVAVSKENLATASLQFIGNSDEHGARLNSRFVTRSNVLPVHGENDLLNLPNGDPGTFDMLLSLRNEPGPDDSITGEPELALVKMAASYANGSKSWTEPHYPWFDWSATQFERDTGANSPTKGRSLIRQVSSFGIGVAIAEGDIEFRCLVNQLSATVWFEAIYGGF